MQECIFMGSFSTNINSKKSPKVIGTETKASTRKKNLTPSQQLSTFHFWQVLTTPFACMRSYRFVCNVLWCLPLICVGLLERLVSLSFPQLQTATPAWSPPTIPFFVNRSVPENFQREIFSGQVPTESLRNQDSENVVGEDDWASVSKLQRLKVRS